MVSGYIPMLNNKLSYYFNELDVDSGIKFNELLNIETDKWSHEVYSGGEKKRVDLAIMCSLYDTFITMHGSKSNILVLDEIDKDLDRDGVDEYVRLVTDDLSSRIETILIISHKNDINYAFPSQIRVRKENGFSFIDDDQI